MSQAEAAELKEKYEASEKENKELKVYINLLFILFIQRTLEIKEKEIQRQKRLIEQHEREINKLKEYFIL